MLPLSVHLMVERMKNMYSHIILKGTLGESLFEIEHRVVHLCFCTRTLCIMAFKAFLQLKKKAILFLEGVISVYIDIRTTSILYEAVNNASADQ